MALVTFASRYVLVLALLAATAWSAGSLVSTLLRRGGNTTDGAPWPVRMAGGVAILGHAMLLLGLLGWLRASLVAALVFALNIAAAAEWRRLVASALRALRERPRAEITTWIWQAALAALLACPSFVLALYPPLGFDQTMYHLPYARAFAASGSLSFLPALRFPVFPQLTEVLDAALLLLMDDVATQMVGYLGLACCAGLVFVWAREQDSRVGGWLAVGILVGSPTVVYLAATGYVEPILALFGLASLYAAERVHRQQDIAWAIAAGALAGSAASVKYLGLFFVAAAALLLVRLDRRPATWRALACYGLAAGAALAPTYGRIVALTGNPVFPFHPWLFGSSAWDAQEYLGRQGWDRLGAAATFLWDAAFRRELVGGLPHWSPAFAIGAPVALVGAWRWLGLRRLLIVAAGYVLVAPVNAHYFLAIAPLWAIVIAVAVSRVARPWRQHGRIVLAAAAVIALGGDAYAVYRIHRLGLPPTTAAGRESLLAAQLPLYPAVAALNRLGGPITAYGVHAEQMVYYADGPLLGDHFGPASYTRIAGRARVLGSVASALDEIGASYLLVPTVLVRWHEWAAADRRLVRIFRDEGGSLYRVLPASPPSGPSAASPCTRQSDDAGVSAGN